ncbi:MAG TPA: PaaI family thioesterase [Phycisphaerae bacterium]|nr:PaaI family thioesterase [Phycisphaerae bacterium]HSA25375.1 PaaI family thioesterase [Phycisphaerae bacterium]
MTTSVITDLSRKCHPSCLVCGSDRPDGLGLRFQRQADGSVIAEFDCGATFQGYPDRMHGGVTAMLLDAAMTHCLFARNVAGLTAKLAIRYHRAVTVGVPATVRARIVDAQPPLYYLESEVAQNGDIRTTAKATFWDSACGDLACESDLDSAENRPVCSPQL